VNKEEGIALIQKGTAKLGQTFSHRALTQIIFYFFFRENGGILKLPGERRL